jgi:hypothetical protein
VSGDAVEQPVEMNNHVHFFLLSKTRTTYPPDVKLGDGTATYKHLEDHSPIK